VFFHRAKAGVNETNLEASRRELTMAYQTFPWNKWIESLRQGEPELFLAGLQRAVFGNAYFKGKRARDIEVEYAE
jgi:hypothetical protein